MGKIISTEYVHAGEEKDPRIVAHNTPNTSTQHSLKRMLKRAVGSEKKNGSQEKEKENERAAARNGGAEPISSRSTTTPPRLPSLSHLQSSNTNAHKQSSSSSSSGAGTSPYPSLSKAHPRFKDMLDVGNWPTLPAPTNSARTAEQGNGQRQSPGKLDLLVRPRREARNDALSPPPYSGRDAGKKEEEDGVPEWWCW